MAGRPGQPCSARHQRTRRRVPGDLARSLSAVSPRPPESDRGRSTGDEPDAQVGAAGGQPFHPGLVVPGPRSQDLVAPRSQGSEAVPGVPGTGATSSSLSTVTLGDWFTLDTTANPSEPLHYSGALTFARLLRLEALQIYSTHLSSVSMLDRSWYPRHHGL